VFSVLGGALSVAVVALAGAAVFFAAAAVSDFASWPTARIVQSTAPIMSSADVEIRQSNTFFVSMFHSIFINDARRLSL
jgi:hypothetical protein